MKIEIHSKGEYELLSDFIYYSPRYLEVVIVKKGLYDGATGAMDITTKAWWVHDQICKDPYFRSGKPITAWQASCILHDVLNDEGRWFRKYSWQYSTFLFGCKLAKKNGWF